MSDVIRIGGRTASTADTQRWVGDYFSTENPRSSHPYAYPAYDHYNARSGPSHVNDGDLLAPALLNAAPTVRAFYSLQRVRRRLSELLAKIPETLTLEQAIANGDGRNLLGDLVAVLDEDQLAGVRLTTLLKVLHRKRPEFIPLYDQFVAACYVGEGPEFPVHRDRRRSWRDYSWP
jgi:hypothetical protein